MQTMTVARAHGLMGVRASSLRGIGIQTETLLARHIRRSAFTPASRGRSSKDSAPAAQNACGEPPLGSSPRSLVSRLDPRGPRRRFAQFSVSMAWFSVALGRRALEALASSKW